MNIILLITIKVTLALALAHKPNPKPCMEGEDKGFDNKHILLEDLGVDTAKWKDYLMRKKDLDGKRLCGRVKKSPQSFINESAENVRKVCDNCVSQGRNVKLNLCKSQGTMTVYDVKSTLKYKVCKVKDVTCWERQVVIACDVVKGTCQPVHYEANSGAIVKNVPCSESK